MKFDKIIELQGKPVLYATGTHSMWQDEYISKNLLNMHLSLDNDVASRTEDKIDKIVNFIDKLAPENKINLLDLGCGPGLYAEKLHNKGYKVTGIDFSKRSIEHATKSAKTKNLNIEYICDNYLNINFEEKFDIVIIIYCDFGVLSVNDRNILLKKIYKSLKPGGMFIFDGLNEKILDTTAFQKTFETEKQGFWSDKPYLLLSETFHYPENNAILNQYIKINENEEIELYRFWNHYFNKEIVNTFLTKAGFKTITEHTNIFEGPAQYNGTDLNIYSAIK